MIELTEDALTAWGRLLGAAAEPPLVVALRGDLGAGKTTLARAIARGAGVEEAVPSPTYNLLFRYEVGHVEIVHLDLFRIDDADDVWALGWAELPGVRDVVLIEWPERAEALLPPDRWEVELLEGSDPGVRRVRVTSVGRPGRIPLPEGLA